MKQLEELKGTGNKLDLALEDARRLQAKCKADVDFENKDYSDVMRMYARCLIPQSTSREKVAIQTPKDFKLAVTDFLGCQDEEQSLNIQVVDLFREVEKHFGDRYNGKSERETISNLLSEVESLPEHEEALRKAWEAQVESLRSRFSNVLKEMDAIKNAALAIRRQFARIKVSNLKRIEFHVDEQAGELSWIKRVAKTDELSFDIDRTKLQQTLANLRERFTQTSVIRFSTLFALRFRVVGEDDQVKDYSDFKAVESHGTTITLKVLFNLMVLKELTQKDNCNVPFYLDEIQALDRVNRYGIIETAKTLGFIAITASPEDVAEVDIHYYLKLKKGRITLKNQHRILKEPK